MISVPGTASPVTMPAKDVQRSIDEGRMSPLQIGAVTICVLLNMIDGYDVLVIAFTSTHIIEEWGLTGTEFGTLGSAGLLGMAAGSLFLAPVADRLGRRAIILLSLALVTLGMLFSALSQNLYQLMVLRVVTGLGIGGMLASIGVITAEYSSSRWRSTNVSAQATGYPIGATLGGMVAAVLIAQYGWRAAYLFGGVVSALMVPVVLRYLPESLDFLVARRPPGALEKLNVLLERMRRPAVGELPEPATTEPRAQGNPLPALFSGRLAVSTLLLWSSFFLTMFSFYFVMTWTPRLLVTAGFSAEQGITGSVLLNLGGIAGGALFACLAASAGVRGLCALFLLLTAICNLLFGLAASEAAAVLELQRALGVSLLSIAFPLAVAIGTFMIGSMAGLYSLGPALYPAATRTTGLGWGIGIGRVGAIIAPTVAGVLVDANWSTSALYFAFAVPFLLAAFTTRALRLG